MTSGMVDTRRTVTKIPALTSYMVDTRRTMTTVTDSSSDMIDTDYTGQLSSSGTELRDLVLLARWYVLFMAEPVSPSCLFMVSIAFSLKHLAPLQSIFTVVSRRTLYNPSIPNRMNIFAKTDNYCS